MTAAISFFQKPSGRPVGRQSKNSPTTRLSPRHRARSYFSTCRRPLLRWRNRGEKTCHTCPRKFISSISGGGISTAPDAVNLRPFETACDLLVFFNAWKSRAPSKGDCSGGAGGLHNGRLFTRPPSGPCRGETLLQKSGFVRLGAHAAVTSCLDGYSRPDGAGSLRPQTMQRLARAIGCEAFAPRAAEVTTERRKIPPDLGAPLCAIAHFLNPTLLRSRRPASRRNPRKK